MRETLETTSTFDFKQILVGAEGGTLSGDICDPHYMFSPCFTYFPDYWAQLQVQEDFNNYTNVLTLFTMV